MRCKKIASLIIASCMMLFLFAPTALALNVTGAAYNAATGQWEITIVNNTETPRDADNAVDDYCEVGYYNSDGEYVRIPTDESQESYVYSVDGLKEQDLTVILDAPNYGPDEPVPNAKYSYKDDVKSGTESYLPAEDTTSRTEGETTTPEHVRGMDPIPIIPGNQYSLIINWYIFFGSLGAAIVFMTLIKDSYTIMFSAVNPGIRASYTETLQRILIGVLLVSLIPVILSLLVDVNDAMVGAIAEQFKSIQTAKAQTQTFGTDAVDVISSLVSSVPVQLIKVIEWAFSMQDIQALIFNGHLTSGANETVFRNIWAMQTGNAFSDVIIQIGMICFEVYFNIFYIIRQWTFSLLFVLAPLAVWIWVVSGRNEVITTWAATIVMKIFIQTIHAICFGIFFSFLSAGTAVVSGTTDIAETLTAVQSIVNIGALLAGFGGIICAGILVFLGIKMMFAANETVIAGIKQGMIKALIALGVLMLAWTITPILTTDSIAVVDKPIVTTDAKGNAQADSGDGVSVMGCFIALGCLIGASKTVSSMMAESIQGLGGGGTDEDRILSGMGRSVQTAFHATQIHRTNKLLEQKISAGQLGSVAGKSLNPNPPSPGSPTGGGGASPMSGAGYKVGESLNHNYVPGGIPHGPTGPLPGSSPDNPVTDESIHRHNLAMANAEMEARNPPKPPRQKDADTIHRHAGTAGRVAEKVGRVITPPIVPGAQMLSGKMVGASTKAAGAIGASAAMTGKAIFKGQSVRRLSLDDINGNIREYTGVNNTSEAWARAGLGIVTAPLSPQKSNSLVNSSITAHNWTMDKLAQGWEKAGRARNSIDNMTRRA